MTKAELVAVLAMECSLTKRDAAGFLETLAKELRMAIAQDKRFAWPGFGVFRVTTRKQRTIRNPQTNTLMQLPESKSIGFRAAREFKAALR